MAAKKQTKKENRVRYAHFRVFDRLPQGNKLVEKPAIPVDEFGKIPAEELAKLKAYDSTRNRVVHCENELAMNNLHPTTEGSNIVLTAENVVRVFELAVEQEYPINRIPFQLYERWGLEIGPDAIKNCLNGKTRREVEVPRNLREKWLQKKATATPSKKGSKGTSLELKVDVILRIEGGESGKVAGRGEVVSSTANGWWRSFRGRYRDGTAIPEDQLPPWVEKVREIIKTRLEQGEVDDKVKGKLAAFFGVK